MSLAHMLLGFLAHAEICRKYHIHVLPLLFFVALGVWTAATVFLNQTALCFAGAWTKSNRMYLRLKHSLNTCGLFTTTDQLDMGELPRWSCVTWNSALRRTTVSALMRPHSWRLHQMDCPGASRRSYSLVLVVADLGSHLQSRLIVVLVYT